ncbi:hypothetical protein ASPZODRAFT_105474 [Penicilliopsis zonata CBS 506.65]|uniref:AB hydrolase-1 domain-containing protein n=1 Tax=Penicilliopsis zonata CBS 506.65 TaxID=1073090 RepID=A0A1L9S560_9EURO|nr:hypothetical protein ASPZODRAFT_105474 [Penicilliopsis zonata CBS 506.65]OJJ42300.1 hypothetical protein ASPZODRAFT_105474 [Penicilliopsis zonata CBS 506.65]
MSFPFHITEHVIDAAYIRDNARATATPDAPLKLCVKQYSPIDNLDPRPGDVTVVAANGIGFPKEVYEPLWEELLARSKKDGFRIRAIWMADPVNQGASGILNEQHLGNDWTWSDNSRDILHMVSHFRTEMPRPILGIGHSAGAGALILASLFHPSLFSSLLLIEPWITDQPGTPEAFLLLVMATQRRDTWRSRAEATEKLRRNLRNWDPRAFQRWTEFVFRELPTAIYPSPPAQPGAVTLATTKHQEVMSLTYINPRKQTIVQFPGEESEENRAKQKALVPGRQGYRTESIAAFKLMPHLGPSTLLISGSQSPLYKSGKHTDAAKIAGTGFGGNGGMASGRVRHVAIDKGTHSLPMEEVEATAEAMGPWIQQEMQRWKQDEAQLAQDWVALSTQEKLTFPSEWIQMLEILKAKI